MCVMYTTWPINMHINKATVIISSSLQDDLMPILSFGSNLQNIVGETQCGNQQRHQHTVGNHTVS